MDGETTSSTNDGPCCIDVFAVVAGFRGSLVLVVLMASSISNLVTRVAKQDAVLRIWCVDCGSDNIFRYRSGCRKQGVWYGVSSSALSLLESLLDGFLRVRRRGAGMNCEFENSRSDCSKCSISIGINGCLGHGVGKSVSGEAK